jgi:hypothetical protein
LVNNVEKPTTPLPPLPLLSSIAIKPLGRYIFIGFIAPSRHPFFRPFLSSPFFYIPLQQKLQHTSFSPLSSFSCTSFFFFSLRQILLYLLKLLLSMLARFLFFPSHEHCFFFFFTCGCSVVMGRRCRRIPSPQTQSLLLCFCFSSALLLSFFVFCFSFSFLS